MNGMKKPDFLAASVDQSYYAPQNPYILADTGNVNLLLMSRYAQQHGKKMCELTSAEVEQFVVAKQ